MHTRDAAIEWYKALVVKSNDTDIVVIAVSVLPQLQEIGVETLWTSFWPWCWDEVDHNPPATQ